MDFFIKRHLGILREIDTDKKIYFKRSRRSLRLLYFRVFKGRAKLAARLLHELEEVSASLQSVFKCRVLWTRIAYLYKQESPENINFDLMKKELGEDFYKKYLTLHQSILVREKSIGIKEVILSDIKYLREDTNSVLYFDCPSYVTDKHGGNSNYYALQSQDYFVVFEKKSWEKNFAPVLSYGPKL